jgi:RNA-directed DNA polymerase
MSSKLLEDLFRAYFDARKNKRKTISALKFELNYEAELFKLHDEIISRKYAISPSICFISFYPVRREIFAGDFRDRIVHHLIFNYLNPFCERIFSNDSYSCRTGKGTSYGVKRANHFIRSCSENYQKDCYILKLDISGYFMSIDKNILFEKIEKILKKFKSQIDFDYALVLWLVQKVIFNDPTENCVVKGKKEDWVGLPKSKSLFFSVKDSGLPIGNLTSQLFANLYLNEFDYFVKYKLKCKYYGRYVDDLLFIHQDKKFLASLFSILDAYLRDNLMLRLHSKKIYLQHFKHGVVFLGRFILPYRVYLKNRTKGNIHKKIEQWLIISGAGKISQKQKRKAVSRYFSYSGMLKSCNAYKLSQKFKRMIFRSGRTTTVLFCFIPAMI